MNTARRAVPRGTARQIESAPHLRGAGHRLIEPARMPLAFSGGKFAHPIEGIAKRLSFIRADNRLAKSVGALCIGRPFS
ncbi:protein of unknown function [Caballeronia sp. S22]|jgi:hypothetical protein